MKKTLSLLLAFVFMVLTFAGCGTGSQKASKKDIENRLLYNKITNSANYIYLNEYMSRESFETYYNKSLLPEDREEIKASFAEDFAICNECKEKGILINRSKAKENAETEYGNLQTDETQSDYFVALKKAIADNGIDEDKYLDLLYSEAYYKYNRIVLKMDFNKNLYDENGSGTDEEQFEAYVKSLTE